MSKEAILTLGSPVSVLHTVVPHGGRGPPEGGGLLRQGHGTFTTPRGTAGLCITPLLYENCKGMIRIIIYFIKRTLQSFA